MQAFQSRIFPFREIFAAAGFALALLAPVRVEAQPKSYEASEVSKLPGYCKYTQTFRGRVPGSDNAAEIERWTRVMGDTFIHMHHYCFGLMAVNSSVSLSNTPMDRRHYLSVSINEFDYILRHAPLDFALLPEILTRKGESLIQLDRAGEGMLEFQRAIKIQANYTPAYAAMSDFYKKAGQPAKAREWLEKGLSAAPNARALVRRLAELDDLKDKRKTAPGPARKPATTPPFE
jgi:tetratricopeptide (TPR) repeat protein